MPMVSLFKMFVGLCSGNYCPSQQLWSWRDGQLTKQHCFSGASLYTKAANQYSVHIILLVTDNCNTLLESAIENIS